LVFTVPIAILTLGAMVFAAGPSEVLNTVSQGLNLTHRAKPVRPCNWWTCHKPKPVPSGRGSTSPAPAPAPTQPATPAPTATPTPTGSAPGSPGDPPASSTPPADPPPSAPGTTPKAPPVTVCANSNLLSGPSSAPSGAVSVPAGDNSKQFAYRLPDNTTYYFAPGLHYLGSGQYSQIEPGSNDTFIGAPGAIISGQNPNVPGYEQNNFAFVGNGSTTGVTIEYLTIANFSPPGSQGAVNTGSDDNWTVAHSTLQDNAPGAAMMLGSGNTVEYNCMTRNGQYAFNGYQTPGDPQASKVTGGPQNIVLSGNEISYNNTCNWDEFSNFPVKSPPQCAGAGQFSSCGCDGGGKFWQDQDVTITNNYVHNNYSVGIWADSNNNGFNIQGNYFSANFGEALVYEISYNALIKNNAFVDNTWGEGPLTQGFPDGAVYISESGGDSRVPNGFGYTTLAIQDNTFTDNWSGVTLWENSNRACGDGYDDVCTLVAPSVATTSSCQKGLTNSAANQPGDSPDYFDLCRWKTQNVTVSGNVFSLNPANVGSNCTKANYCGFNALFSEYGSVTPYKAWVVLENISNHQNNVFKNNTYNGPWNFLGFSQGDVITWSQWTAGFDDGNGSNDHFNGQDAGSTYSA
jgi:hypothetical protein